MLVESEELTDEGARVVQYYTDAVVDDGGHLAGAKSMGRRDGAEKDERTSSGQYAIAEECERGVRTLPPFLEDYTSRRCRKGVVEME